MTGRRSTIWPSRGSFGTKGELCKKDGQFDVIYGQERYQMTSRTSKRNVVNTISLTLTFSTHRLRGHPYPTMHGFTQISFLVAVLLLTLPLCAGHVTKGEQGRQGYDLGTLFPAQGHLEGSEGRLIEADDDQHIVLVDNSMEEDFRLEGLRELQMHPVPLGVVQEKMRHVHTFHDVLRIFYGEEGARLNNREIEDVLIMRQRPRIANTMAFGPDYGGHSLSEALKRATAHSKEMTDKIPCREPVAECVNAGDISVAANKIYFPKCTVVYKCRKDAGCCDRGKECAATNSTKIRRYFWTMDMKGGEVVASEPPAAWFSFVNDTQCACLPIKAIPQRCKACPHPYVQVNDEVGKCTCDCPRNQKTCSKIKRGIVPLHAKQLACIKRNECELPTCKIGAFSIQEGYCRHKSQDDGSGKSSRESQYTSVSRTSSSRVGFIGRKKRNAT